MFGLLAHILEWEAVGSVLESVPMRVHAPVAFIQGDSGRFLV